MSRGTLKIIKASMNCTTSIKAMPFSGIIRRKSLAQKIEIRKSSKKFRKLSHTSNPKLKGKKTANINKVKISDYKLYKTKVKTPSI